MRLDHNIPLHSINYVHLFDILIYVILILGMAICISLIYIIVAYSMPPWHIHGLNYVVYVSTSKLYQTIVKEAYLS